ncbi:MAG: hypothetical protein ACD_59C00110G0005 [uncultured bacterium]|nr:MAG: hypothetical protein ACD_59C00110G0005 [uncultured bacterium]
MEKHNLIREIRELKNYLSYSKNIGFFFGAGCSCALGIPNIAQLTDEIEKLIYTDPSKEHFKIIKDDLKTLTERKINIEDILNQIRQIRTITGEKKEKTYLIDGCSAKTLDINICKNIYKIISEKETKAKFENTKKFIAWLSMQNRDFSKEIFTTNYDLIIEKSLEEAQIPYFDGFVGSYEPFFWNESIEIFVNKSDLTQNWIRLWKLHGSLNWFWKKDIKTNTHKIIRSGKVDNFDVVNNELVIYPSREKYDSSRKQPFLAYFDRFKKYLLNGELLFIFTGYSFSDQHINEIILNCLRQNNRLFVTVFLFADIEVENLYKLSSSYLNLSVYGPTKAIINGVIGEWDFQENDLKPNENYNNYWDKENKKLIIGDYNYLVNFIVSNSGKNEAIEALTNEK